MRVVRVGPPQGRLGHQRVAFDSGAAVRLHPSDISALGVQAGTELDDAVARQLRMRAERALAVEIAHRLLAVRLRSRMELVDRLRRRGISPDVLATVIADLERHGLVDDHRFADAWVQTRLALQPSGRVRLRYELAHKGVAREVINKALGTGFGDRDEGTLALEVARARVRRYRGLPSNVIYRRLGGLLQRRGFSSAVVIRVLQQVLGAGTPSPD